MTVMIDKLERLLKAGSYLQVRRQADRSLLEGNLSIREQGAVLRMAGRACLNLADFYAAAKLGERAIERAREAEDVTTLGMAHFDLGVAYTHIGDTYGAEQHFDAFLELAPRLAGMMPWEGRAHYSLSIIHRQRKHWHMAITMLDRAAAIFEQTDQALEQARCAHDSAWCYLMLGASTLAAPYLTRVGDYLQASPDDALSADLICLKAFYYRLEGDIATSAQLCQEIFVPGRPGVTSSQMGQASWIMGENALDLGRLEESHIFMNMALDHAARAIWPSLMNLAGDLRRRVAGRMAASA